jgi:hypothetical protein
VGAEGELLATAFGAATTVKDWRAGVPLAGRPSARFWVATITWSPVGAWGTLI